MSTTAATTTIDGNLCDLSVVSSPTFEQSLANPAFSEFIKTFAVNRNHPLESETSTLRFPVDASLGTVFDRVDPTLREKYTASIVGLAKIPKFECDEAMRFKWSEEQMEEVAISALEDVGISAGEHDRRLGRFSTYYLEELTRQTIPDMGQLVEIKGRPVIVQKWQSGCC